MIEACFVPSCANSELRWLLYQSNSCKFAKKLLKRALEEQAHGSYRFDVMEGKMKILMN